MSPTLMAAAHLTWPEITSYVTLGAHDARLAAWYRGVVYSDESNGLLTRYLALWQPSAPVGVPAPGVELLQKGESSAMASYDGRISLGEPVFTVTTPSQPRVQLCAGESRGDVDYAQSAFFGRRPPQHIAGGRNWCSSHGRWNAPMGGQPGAATLGDLLGQEDPPVEHMPGMGTLAARWGELPRREQEILLIRLHGA
jgi:hypothetical protein